MENADTIEEIMEDLRKEVGFFSDNPYILDAIDRLQARELQLIDWVEHHALDSKKKHG